DGLGIRGTAAWLGHRMLPARLPAVCLLPRGHAGSQVFPPPCPRRFLQLIHFPSHPGDRNPPVPVGSARSRYVHAGRTPARDDHYDELKSTARRQLGDLYDANDYPPQLRGLFGIDWEFPSVEPPDYLLQLSPELYERERARVAGRFDDAVQMAEQAFIGELGR